KEIIENLKKLKIFLIKKKFIKHFNMGIEYLRDMQQIRPPQIKIQFDRSSALSPLRAYQFLHSRWWSGWVYVCIWTHVLLALWEPPQLTAIPLWIGLVELACLLMYCIDLWLRFFCLDAKYLGKWTYFVIVLIC
ncbi:hypothetical protein RFI_33510, partial [Reticulomyxa filosa]